MSLRVLGNPHRPTGVGWNLVWRVFVLVMFFVRIGFGQGVPNKRVFEEVCQWGEFNASCGEGEIILIDAARYGRIKTGKCANMETGEQPCFTDVLNYIDRQCGGRKSCEVKLPNRELDRMPGSCTKERSRYLDISYHCQKVYTAGNQSCIANQSINVLEPDGYFANIITDETDKGSSLCPWKIHLQQGQTISLTLLDFGVYHNTLPSSEKDTICVIYGIVNDRVKEDGPGILVCARDTRETPLLTTMANEVQISVTKSSNRPDDQVYFLIQYKVFGCPEFVEPDDTSVEKINSGYRVTCKESAGIGSWEVHCVTGKWIPSQNVSCAGRFHEPSASGDQSNGLHQGLLIVIVIAVAIVISTIIIVVGIYVLKKRKSFSTGEGLLDSPVFDKHGNILYNTPTLGKRCVVPGTPDRLIADPQRDYATTLQMRQMVLPSAVMQPECLSVAGGNIWMCPVHGVRSAGIPLSNGSLSRRNLGSFRPRMEHIYELPVFEVEVNPKTQSGEASTTPASPFYHELDPNLPETSGTISQDLESLSVPPAVMETPGT